MADLDAIIRHSGLQKQALLRECPREIRIRIALKLTGWKVLGHILGLSKETLASIEVDNQSEEERKIALLDSWHEKESANATILKLAEGLRDHSRGDLISYLFNLTQSHGSLTELGSDSRHSVHSVMEEVQAGGIA